MWALRCRDPFAAPVRAISAPMLDALLSVPSPRVLLLYFLRRADPGTGATHGAWRRSVHRLLRESLRLQPRRGGQDAVASVVALLGHGAVPPDESASHTMRLCGEGPHGPEVVVD